MIKLIRTNAKNQDFISLVEQLDREVMEIEGEEYSFFQFNMIDTIKYVVIAYKDGQAVGCGAFKRYQSEIVEIKRMFVKKEARGNGAATKILRELEAWSGELNYSKCILETGKNLPNAIKLYLKNGYELMPNYGQYQGVESSVCFIKKIE